MSAQWLRWWRAVAETVTEISASGKLRKRWQANLSIKHISTRGCCSSSSSSSSSIMSKTILSNGKVMLKLHHLPLQQCYGTNASINRVPKPCLRLISERVHGVLALLLRHLDEDLAHIAGTKHLVHLGEFLALVWAKVWGKYAIGYAPSLQELAGCTRWAWTWLVALHGFDSRVTAFPVFALYPQTVALMIKCMVLSIGITLHRYLRATTFHGLLDQVKLARSRLAWASAVFLRHLLFFNFGCRAWW